MPQCLATITVRTPGDGEELVYVTRLKMLFRYGYKSEKREMTWPSEMERWEKRKTVF